MRTHPRLVRMQGHVLVVRQCSGAISVTVCPAARKSQDPVTVSFWHLLMTPFVIYSATVLALHWLAE